MKNLLSFRNIIKFFIASAVLLGNLGFTSAVMAQSSCGATYTVQRGDYLTKIAKTCGVSYSDLLKANPNITNPSLVYAGQVLNIPSSSIPVTGTTPAVYTVKAGDTLFSIGRTFGLSAAELRAANPALGATLNAGTALNIPARLRFATGGTAASVLGKLGANSKHTYLLGASAEQILEVTHNAPAGLTLAILGADGSTVSSASSSPTFRGVLSKTQDYVLVLTSGAGAVDYSLNIDIPTRIRFASGGTAATLTGSVPANLSQYFILRAAKGQTLNVTATPNDRLQLRIYGFDGTVLKSGMGEGPSFSGVLPSSQDYILALQTANQVQAFTLNVSVPATPSVPVTGATSYTVKAGDTLFSIAKSFNTSVTILLRANPDITNQNNIPVGQVIYLPGASIKQSNGKIVYIARPSDTMSIIARQFNVTLTNLINANTQISNPNLIYTGQRINIP